MRNVVAILILCVSVTIVAPSQILTTLVDFDGSNGSTPFGGLIQGSDGNFYGTTDGGYNSDGTVFKITPDGTLTILHNFNATDGAHPRAPLVQGKDAYFYGTTTRGGPNYNGVVFKVNAQGDFQVLHYFTATDGDGTSGALVQGADGDFYGASWVGVNDVGTVYKISADGTFTTLYTFDVSDGAYPNGLVLASDGNFYGTTSQGGSKQLGTVFQITPAGTLTTIYNFCTAKNCTDGNTPYTGLVQGNDGYLYGTTSSGGANNWGTSFKITLDGMFTKLFDYCFGQSCLLSPGTSPILGIDGNFYGTERGGGSENAGFIYQMTPTGKVTTLYNFLNESDGSDPYAALVQAKDGTFYSTTLEGGPNNNCVSWNGCGTAFRFDSGLFPILSVAKAVDGTVSSTDHHIYCGTACSYVYLKGAQITLSAIPAPGYTFSGWTGCNNVNGSYCSVTMTTAKDITATFNSATQVTLASLTFNPAYVRGGQLSAGTLTLSESAPSGGLTVALGSDHPGVGHPPSFVFVPGNASSVKFAVNTFPVKSNTTVTIMATAGASEVSAKLTVGTIANPPSLR